MTLVAIDMIENGERLRGVDEAQVTALVNSIADVGLLNPVTVYKRQLYRGGETLDGFGLIAGLHRKTACERLGLVEIEANIVSLSELERQIAECDENLCASQLSPTDRARFTARRKEAYEALHPETRHGAPLKQGDEVPSRQVGDTGNADRFTADTAKSTGASERSVQRNAERGEKVIDEVLDMIRGTKLDTGAYLDKLKRLPPNEQFSAAKRDLALDKKAAKEQRQQQQAQFDRQRDEARRALPDTIRQHEAAKQSAIARHGGGLSDQDRIAELEEALRVAEADNATLKADAAKYGPMRVLFDAGGFEAVIAAKDEEIRVLKSRVSTESADKASWAKSVDYWKKAAIESGWKGSAFIPLDGGEVVFQASPSEPLGPNDVFIPADELSGPVDD